MALPLCVSAPDFPLCEDATYTRVGPRFNLITSVRTLCPKKVTFWGYRGLGLPHMKGAGSSIHSKGKWKEWVCVLLVTVLEGVFRTEFISLCECGFPS